MRSFVFLLSLLFLAPAFAAGIPIFYDPSVGTPSVTTIDDASIKIVGQQRCVGGRSAGFTLAGVGRRPVYDAI